MSSQQYFKISFFREFAFWRNNLLLSNYIAKTCGNLLNILREDCKLFSHLENMRVWTFVYLSDENFACIKMIQMSSIWLIPRNYTSWKLEMRCTLSTAIYLRGYVNLSFVIILFKLNTIFSILKFRELLLFWKDSKRKRLEKCFVSRYSPKWSSTSCTNKAIVFSVRIE